MCCRSFYWQQEKENNKYFNIVYTWTIAKIQLSQLKYKNNYILLLEFDKCFFFSIVLWVLLFGRKLCICTCFYWSFSRIFYGVSITSCRSAPGMNWLTAAQSPADSTHGLKPDPLNIFFFLGGGESEVFYNFSTHIFVILLIAKKL